MNTAVVFTLNDQSKPWSSLFTMFGNPNDYVWRLANLNAYLNQSTDVRFLYSTSYDFFHAVAVDAHKTRIYHGNNADGTVEYTRIYRNNSLQYWSYFAPPITKRV